AVTNFIDGLHELGASAEEIIDRVRERFASNSAVTAIVGAPPVQLPVVPPAPSQPVTPVWTPPAALPAPPISQTVNNILAPTVLLLPAGQMLTNSLPVTVAAIALPNLVLQNADGSDAANTAAAGAAAEAIRELGETGDPNCD